MSTGDDGTSKEAVSTGKLNQENEHIYNLWCSGRVCCEGMLIQLKVWVTCCTDEGVSPETSALTTFLVACCSF